MYIVEVFKTNIKDRHHAKMVVDQIHKTFIHYKANFDLEDCDKILRVKCIRGLIEAREMIMFLQQFGCVAEVLPDSYPVQGKALLGPIQLKCT